MKKRILSILLMACMTITLLPTAAFAILVEAPPAPTGLAGFGPTVFNGQDGKITGTESYMEYKLKTADDSTYAACTATETTAWAAGIYLVRYKADGIYPAGATAEVTVPMQISGDVEVGGSSFDANQESDTSIVNYAGKEWYVIGAGGASETEGAGALKGVAPRAGTLTLLAKDNLKTDVAFDSADNTYDGSNLKVEMDKLAAVNNGSNGGLFTQKERDAIEPVTLTGGSANDAQRGMFGANVANAILWPLDAAEANAVNASIRMAASDTTAWWLRSPGEDSGSAALVKGSVNVDSSGDSVVNGWGVRPAFILDMSTFLFDMPVAGGKSNAAGSDNFLEIEDYESKALSLRFSGLIGATISVVEEVVEDEGSSVITYTAPANSVLVVMAKAMVVTDSGGAEMKVYVARKNIDTAVTSPATLDLKTLTGLSSGDVQFAVWVEQMEDTANNKGIIYAINYEDGYYKYSAPNQNQLAPTGLAGVAPTAADKEDGKITGTTTAMQYKFATVDTLDYVASTETVALMLTDYTDCTGTEITGLPAGKYLVRYAMKDGYNPGATTEVTVPAYGTQAPGGDYWQETPAQPTKIIVNGKEQTGGTETKTTENGRSTVTVKLDNKVVEGIINDAIKNNTTGATNVFQVPVADTKSDVTKVELTGDVVKKLEEKTFDVSVKRDNVEYVIPAEEFTISKVAQNLGLQEKDLKDIKVEVRITNLDEKVVAKYNEVAKANGAELVFPPVSFEVVAKATKADGTTETVEISKFNNYVERVMEIPAGVDPSKITTGIVFNPDGTYSHVPTEVFQKDGKWYAKLNSLTNSNYSLIYNPVTVKSVGNHWAKDAVNDMASRMVIVNPESFSPDKAITRADFAEYIVRALGVYREGATHENKFKDVSATGDRTLAILTANEYGIVTGYPDGTFMPDALITREEAMAMIQRAMKVTKLTGSDQNRYQSYTDFKEVSGWAEANVKEVLAAHVINGTTTTAISPSSNITYAEAAQAIKNLLVESDLINK